MTIEKNWRIQLQKDLNERNILLEESTARVDELTAIEAVINQ